MKGTGEPQCNGPSSGILPEKPFRISYLVVCLQATGIRHRAALAAGIMGRAVEVHVLRPVLVRDATTAAELQGGREKAKKQSPGLWDGSGRPDKPRRVIAC